MKSLLSTDEFFRTVLRNPEFQREMGTAELHYLMGKYVAERERVLGVRNASILACAYRNARSGVHVVAGRQFHRDEHCRGIACRGLGVRIDVLRDVNETAALVLDAKRRGGKSGVLIFGGGSPKNFMLQTEPQIQEVLNIKEKGHDYFLQITDARPDTGGLSGATPSEAVSWGKVDPSMLPDTVVVYLDSTVAMPILTSYALARKRRRRLKRLYDRRDEAMALLKREYEKARKRSR